MGTFRDQLDVFWGGNKAEEAEVEGYNLKWCIGY